MRQRLCNAIMSPTATRASVLETLEYLAVHLAAHSISERCAAAHSLALLLDVSFSLYFKKNVGRFLNYVEIFFICLKISFFQFFENSLQEICLEISAFFVSAYQFTVYL